MHSLGYVFLGALIAHFLVGFVASWLNLRALRGEVPPELRAVYDPERLARAKEQVRAQTYFGHVTASFELLTLVVFWQAGGFEWLDQALRGLGYGSIVTGLLFVGTLAFGKLVLDLPFSLWNTFVLEERFGFNRTTGRTFAIDLMKSLALTLALGTPILALLLYFFERAGASAWLWAWLAITAILLALQVVVPTWILPLFHRFEPLPAGDLRAAIDAYAHRVGFALQGIYVVDGSKRSSRANAFFVGLGRNRRIALYDTLIQDMEVPELVAVLAHEVGHFKRRHVPKLVALSILHLGALFFLLSLCLGQPAVFQAFGVSQPSIYAGLVFFALLYSPIERVLGPLLHLLERRYEFEADAFAASTTGAPRALAAALAKLGVDNLLHPAPHPFYVALHHSHPPIALRLRALAVQPA
jgi:STE24 endopeptidase